MTNKIITSLVLLSLICVVLVGADTGYAQITEKSCDACSSCPDGLICVNFPDIGSRCAEPDPCNYFECPLNNECSANSPAIAQLCSDGSTGGGVPRVRCSCVGSECPDTNGGVPISYNVKTGEVTIGSSLYDVSIKKEEPIAEGGYVPGSSGVLSIDSYDIKYSGNVEIQESELIMKTDEGDKQINLLPQEAIETSGLNRAEVELREDSQEPIYYINGEKSAKILGIFSTTMKIETKVNAENRKIVSVNKPWWSFLAKEE